MLNNLIKKQEEKERLYELVRSISGVDINRKHLMSFARSVAGNQSCLPFD